MSNSNAKPSFNKKDFLTNFQGMEDLAKDTIESFLSTLPKLISSIHDAIQKKNSADLEISAHTLKGAASNFCAEPVSHLAWKLEQLGHGQITDDAEKIFQELTLELARLSKDLKELTDERRTA